VGRRVLSSWKYYHLFKRWGKIQYDGWKREYTKESIQYFSPIAKNSTGFGLSIGMDDMGHRVFVTYTQPFDIIEHYVHDQHIQSIRIQPIPVTSPHPMIGYHISCYGHYVAFSAPGMETDPSGSIYIYTFDHNSSEAILPSRTPI
jgi:hypothetical protein